MSRPWDGRLRASVEVVSCALMLGGNRRCLVERLECGHLWSAIVDRTAKARPGKHAVGGNGAPPHRICTQCPEKQKAPPAPTGEASETQSVPTQKRSAAPMPSLPTPADASGQPPEKAPPVRPCSLCEGVRTLPLLDPETFRVESVACPHCGGSGREPAPEVP